jgi:hypothetical protein
VGFSLGRRSFGTFLPLVAEKYIKKQQNQPPTSRNLYKSF